MRFIEIYSFRARFDAERFRAIPSDSERRLVPHTAAREPTMLARAPAAPIARARPPAPRARASVARAAPSDASAVVASRRVALALPLALAALDRSTARAADAPRVLVVGATGQTGALVVRELSRAGRARAIVAGARSAAKATKLGLDALPGVEILDGVDVTRGVDALALAFEGFDVVVVATGFVPGNPLKMNAAARAVDNEGVCAVADAAKRANVKRVVLISSILTNGPGFGAQDTAGYKITNAFGRVLEEKLVGENHLRASGVPWTIVRPAGLKTDAPKNPLVVTGEDVMTSGEISRELVARVMVEAAFDARAEGKVYEIAESGSFVGGDPAGAKTFALDSDPASWFA